MNCRVAENFIRFGNFELYSMWDNTEFKELLLSYLFRYFHKDLMDLPKPQSYVLWLKEVIKRSAYLVAQWQGNGFVHGVLNTDNMSVEGLTIDYGPFGMMEKFESGYRAN